MSQPVSSREENMQILAEALRLQMAGFDCLEKSQQQLMQGDLSGGVMSLSEYIDESSQFAPNFTGWPVNQPILLGLGIVFVQVYLMRATALMEWCKQDSSLCDQLLPIVRSDLQIMLTWPDEWFVDDVRPLFQDLKRRFRL